MPRKAVDLSGKRFERLVVQGIAFRKNENIYWKCICDCGNRTKVEGYKLTSGHTKSCGCYKMDAVTTHSMTNTPTYTTWATMIQRCHNPNSANFDRYGMRGIKVCNRWRNSFEAFLEDMGERPEGTTIDRIDNEGNYEPSNCRWATIYQQQRNLRSNVNVEVDGITMCFKDACAKTGIDYKTAQNRIYKLGMTPQEAIENTDKRTRHAINIDGKIMNFNEACRKIGISPAAGRQRMRRGKTPMQALGLD